MAYGDYGGRERAGRGWGREWEEERQGERYDEPEFDRPGGSYYGAGSFERGYEGDFGRRYEGEFGRRFETDPGRRYEGDLGRRYEGGLGRGYPGAGIGGYGYGQEFGGREQQIGRYRSGMGRGRFAGRGPKGWRRSDDRITDEVSEALARHPDIDASDLEVRVEDGNVTLRGVVDDRPQKRLAEDIAEDVFGVEDINNELKIRHGFLAGLTGEKAEEREIKRGAERETGKSGTPTSRTTTGPRTSGRAGTQAG